MAASVLIACESDPTQSPQYQQLSEDAQRTEAVVAQRDSTINALFGAMNRISENLRTIRAKQGQLAQPAEGVETDADMEKRIMDDISSIDGLLAENRSLVERMRKQAKQNAASMAELERTIADLESTITAKDEEVAALKEQLSSTNASLATLIDMYRDKSQLADMQRGELNTAYYAVGTAKELRANGVLAKTGGVAGIGSTDKLNTENLAQNYFTRMDVTMTLEIPVMAKKAKLATTHPAGSYKFENGAEKLVITDPNAFWSMSKYLVIVTE
jgi:phage shock protein A